MKIDWAYLRKGWTSCANAREFLGEEQIEAGEVVDARKERIDAEGAWRMLQPAASVTVAKGKSVLRFTRLAEEKDAILKSVMGPSGNLRAPTLKVGDDFVVGFNREMYEKWFK